MKFLVFFGLTVALFGTVFGVIRPGQCPTKTVQANFEIERYFGVWYEVARYYRTNAPNLDCVTAEYGPHETEANVYRFYNRGIYLSSHEPVDTYGNAVRTNPGSTEGRFTVTFDEGGTADYWILETDYYSYAVGYNCVNLDATQYEESTWVLTKYYLQDGDEDNEEAQAVRAAINAAIASHSLVASDLRWTVQGYDNCLPFPPGSFFK